MIRAICLALSLLLCLALPASAAEKAPAYNAETINGMWRADGERTKSLLGEAQAASVAKDPNVCLEFDMAAKQYRVWKDASKKELLQEFPFEVQNVGKNKFVLRAQEDMSLEILILDHDALNLSGQAIVRRAVGE